MRTSTYNKLGYNTFVPVAQLDRALASEAKGCRFKSRRGRFAKGKIEQVNSRAGEQASYHLIYHIFREILDIEGGDC
jgi:hypothetical protein